MVQSTSVRSSGKATKRKSVEDGNENLISAKQQKTEIKTTVTATTTATTAAPSTDHLSLSRVLSLLEQSSDLQRVKNSAESAEDDLESTAQKVLADATTTARSTSVMNKMVSLFEKQADGTATKSTTSSVVAAAAVSSPKLLAATIASAPTDNSAYELINWEPGLPRQQKQPIPAADDVAVVKVWPNNEFPPPKSRPDALFLLSDATRLAVGWDSNPGTTVGTINNGTYWQTNQCFAQQRLTGANPMTIQACSLNELKPKLASFKLAKSDLDGIVKSIGKNDQLFVLDYSYFLTGYNGGTFPANLSNGTVPATFTIFKGLNGKTITPLYIILLRQNAQALVAQATEDVNDQAWKFAKRCVQCTDFNVHEIGYHLTSTHLLMELVIVASKRILNPNGVLFKLLDAHFSKTIKANAEARNTLLVKFAQAAASNEQGTKQIISHYFSSFNWANNYPPNELKARGMVNADGSPVLSSYAYATQALMYWKALTSFFEAVCVKEYDKKGQNIAKDAEVQEWADYIRNESYGNIRGFPLINSSKVLAEVLAMTVFQCTVQHSAINYPQRFYFAFIDNAPAAIYTNYDKWQSFNDVTDDAFTVPEKNGILQKNLVIMLSVSPCSVETLMYTVENYLNESVLKAYASEINQLKDDLTDIGNYITHHDAGYEVINPISNDTTAAAAISI